MNIMLRNILVKIHSIVSITFSACALTETSAQHYKRKDKMPSKYTVDWRIFIFSAILALTGLFCTPQLCAEIYQWVDENGVKHYSNMPPDDVESVRILPGGEYRHDEAADQERAKTDQKAIDALTEEIKTEEQQASVEKQKKLKEEQKKLTEARQTQPPLSISDCFSPSFSIQQGRDVHEAIIPRDLMEGEYQDLQELFQSLDGNWEGDALVRVCEGTQDKARKVVDKYSVKSEGKMPSTGQFDLKATLYSQEKKATHHENLSLYLDPKKLTSEPNYSVADIELISVSSDELAYVEKRQSRSGGGALETRETVTTIKKTGETSFSLKRILYFNGRLITISTYHLESK
jgi:hypothetical protein